jgi:hypothetical protein
MTLTPFRGRCHTCGHDHDAEETLVRDVIELARQADAERRREAAAVPTSAVVPVEVVTLNDAAFALRMALRDMEAIHCPVPESSALVGYFCNRLRAALATLQAAEPAEDHMTHAEWNRRYFPSGLTPVPDNAVPYTEPAAKKDTAA